MNYSATILIGLVICFNGAAQTKLAELKLKQSDSCIGTAAFAKKGSWKKTEDNLVFPDKTFPRSQYKLIYARVDSIYSMVKETFTNLAGIDPEWHRSIREEAYFSNGPVPYSFESYFFEYYCNTNIKKVIREDETAKNIHVFINKLHWFLYLADTLDINNDGKIRNVYQLPPKDGELKGMTVYKLRETQFYTWRSVIIGRNGKVPWNTLTRQQYLTGLKNKFEKEVKRYREGGSFERSAREKLTYINNYLATANEETLNQPVIIDPKSGIWGFKGTFGNEETGGFRLVRFTSSDKYFDKTFPRHEPQIIQLFWASPTSQLSTISKNFLKQLEENFPMEKLKTMIR